MTRDQLTRSLARLVASDKLTRDEARAILAAFDAGLIAQSELPLAGQAAGIALTESLARQAAARLYARLGLDPARTRIIPISARERFVVQIIDTYEDLSFQTTRSFARGDLSVREWHQAMKDLVSDDLLQQAHLGKGRDLTPREIERLQEVATRQAAYLRRFADEVAMREQRAKHAERIARRELGQEATEEAVQARVAELQSRRMSEAQIRARAQMYAGESYQAFWQQREREEEREGMVAYYISVDQPSTCSPCLSAEQNGPYLPGSAHPWPGSVCLGKGHCRCRLEYRLEPDTYARLRARTA